MKYDIAFVGSVHKKGTYNRPFILKYINYFCNRNNLRAYLHLVSDGYRDRQPSLIKRLYRGIVDGRYNKEIEDGKARGYIHSNKLSLDEIDRIYNESKIVLDINHPDRQGMTINCITALGKGKKLITTNRRIKEESFYDSRQIYVLDEHNPLLKIDFFYSDYEPVDISHLSIENWLSHIFNVSDL